MEGACAAAHRDPGEVSLLPVTKTVPPERIAEAAECGLTVFGESRVQEARQKIPLCAGQHRWHVVGHLQTNKVREAVRLFQMVHSVDSERLLRAMESACGEAGVAMPVCVEVNVSGEGSKFGVSPEAAPGLLKIAGELMRVEVVGLMTIPPFTREPAEARPYYRRLRELRDECREGTGLALPHLSMGMSRDFDVAIEEGATWIRLGTILFGEREGGAA
jgi:pyridoxal phosphate enzyme (YggS family)